MELTEQTFDLIVADLATGRIVQLSYTGDAKPDAALNDVRTWHRNARVAALLAEGLAAQDISARLHCAMATVRTHLRRVQMKLSADNVATAARLLRQGEPLWAQVGAAPFASTAITER